MGVMDLKSIKNNNSLDYIEVEAPTSQFIGFDTKNELLKDKRVRQAIAYAVDNNAITQAIYGDSATPGTSVVPPAMTDFNLI
jgi:peptide/nickel transport system substrate-binding protein